MCYNTDMKTTLDFVKALEGNGNQTYFDLLPCGQGMYTNPVIVKIKRLTQDFLVWLNKSGSDLKHVSNRPGINSCSWLTHYFTVVGPCVLGNMQYFSPLGLF